ncbi:CBS domain-containing protein [Pelagibacterium halotolerans]|uniref:CBS domain-containing protein n=1 Tax=Pelagibacterium halotolerans TaxID=531813 RepID=UPI00384A9AAD
MKTVQHILDAKGHDVYAVGPDDTVEDALRMMAHKNIGAVLVMDGERLAGIFTERHYARNVFLKGRTSPTTRVAEVMNEDVLYVEPAQSAEACMALMTDKRIRHFPVLDEGRIVGVISIGDLMKAMIDDREYDIAQLVQYMHGAGRM